jgi:hypothetical protein
MVAGLQISSLFGLTVFPVCKSADHASGFIPFVQLQ